MNRFTPINGNTFIRRNEKANTHLGLHVSEGALVKNHIGKVVSVEDFQSISVDDEVYIPQQLVNDYLVGDLEVAVVKHSELFAKKKDAATLPINKYVLVLKCLEEHELDDDGNVLIYRTDVETTNWCEIIDYASDCLKIDKSDVGRFCIAPESDNKLHRIGHSDYWAIHEDLINFTVGE